MDFSFGLDTYSFLGDVLNVIGLWLLFPKMGGKRWWTFVPLLRDYKLAKCADREDIGKIYCISSFLYGALSYINDIYEYAAIEKVTLTSVTLNILVIGTLLVNLVYNIRIYAGLCEMFKRRKRWMWLWILADGLTTVIWGASKKFEPSYIVVDEKYLGDDTNIMDDVDAIEKGLTINIHSRSVRNMFKTKYLLKDIHLNIEPGKMVLLLGGSGAGKTTFLNAVNGYEPADAQILLNDVDVYKEYEKMKYQIGFVPQQDLIRYSDTVIKTLSDAASLRLPSSVSRADRKKRVAEVLDIFGLTPVKNSIVAKQSGGQKKRISIATEFISDPSLFILDEPDSGLDGILAKDLMRRLHEISRQGKIVIVITHTPDRVIELFDEVIVLAKDENRIGRLVFNGPIDEAKKFFGKDTMEDIVKCVNRKEEGGEGMADELIKKFAEVKNNGTTEN